MTVRGIQLVTRDNPPPWRQLSPDITSPTENTPGGNLPRDPRVLVSLRVMGSCLQGVSPRIRPTTQEKPFLPFEGRLGLGSCLVDG